MDFSPVFIFMTYNSSREEVGLFDTPQKSRERNPPFSIQLDFTQYRRGRDYTVSILTENYFDAFIIQVRSSVWKCHKAMDTFRTRVDMKGNWA